MKLNAMLLCDFYKTTHAEQYPKGLKKLVSYFTPRMSRLKTINHVVMWGLQGFIQEYLIDYFDENFFHRPKQDVINEYQLILNNTLGTGTYSIDKIEKLWFLGYLPLQIRAIKEGSIVPMQVPVIEISNTHKDFAWVVNAIESLMSCSMWHPMISATVGRKYRQIVNHYYKLTGVDPVLRKRALGDFSMRGQESLESATKASAAWLMSFVNTATVPAIHYLQENYDADVVKEDVGYGAISTEHSVMCSNFSNDGDEITMIKRLLTETYPNHSFSMVSDSYDYWNLVDNLLPQCKKEIEEHKGVIGVRGDSGDPVEVVTETVFKLWKHFGGTINDHGYKVLNPKVKAIYGDSITPLRATRIYQILADAGFAANNVTLGVGSFSFQCLEEDDKLQPYTRDTFGIAVKATYGEVDGVPQMIFKNPKGCDFKKSQKGCCRVQYDYVDALQENADYVCQDGLTWEESQEDNLLVPVYKNGKFIKKYSIEEIRNNLNQYDF